jgi:uncharacterized protein YacL
MYKKLFKFMVLILGILLANLITIRINNYMMSYKFKFPQYIFTWIGMAVIILIFYPLFTHIDKWATKAGEKFVRAGKKVIGREIGAVVAFIAALFVLYFFYGREWFHSNVFSAFLKSLSNLF